MTVRRVEEFGAYEFAGEFKSEVYRLIEGSPKAQRAFKYRDQLEDAASGIERAMAEGFGRRNPAEFAQFLRYGLGSLVESVTAVRDGIQRGYFVEANCDRAFTWAERCKTALRGLHASQLREAERRRRAKRRPKSPRSSKPTRRRRGA